MSEYKRVTFIYDGKRYERKGKTLAEAHAKAAELKAALKRGEISLSGNMSVKAWVEDWLEVYKRPTIGEAQYQNYCCHIYNVILPEIGNYKLKEIKDIQLQKILNGRIGKSKSDMSKLKMTINTIFKQAYISRLIPYNPAENLSLPSAIDGTRRSITENERKKILEVAEEHHAGLWIKTLLYTGMRPGETRALDWRHIDFDKKLIHVELAMKASSKEIGAPKTVAGIRDIPINDKLLPDLIKAKRTPFEPVFLQPTTGRRHTPTSMNCLWNSFYDALDISMGAKFKKVKAKDGKYRNKKIMSVVPNDLVPYCLRHTYCTDLQDVGVPINVARYLMGHSDISVTAKIYTHTTDKALQDVADKINGVDKSVAQSVANKAAGTVNA